MELLGGKSYENGIDFTVRNGKEGYIFSARRNASDEIKTVIRGRYTKVKTTSFWEYAISAVITLLFVLLIYFFKDVQDENLAKVGWILALGVFWLGFISFLYVQGKDPKNYATGRYHAVEHKVLNF